jgi:hypothetical protein
MPTKADRSWERGAERSPSRGNSPQVPEDDLKRPEDDHEGGCVEHAALPDVGSLAGAPRWRVQTAGIGREERAKTTNADTLTIALVEPDHWPKKSSTARPAEYADVPPASCKPSPLR